MATPNQYNAVVTVNDGCCSTACGAYDPFDWSSACASSDCYQTGGTCIGNVCEYDYSCLHDTQTFCSEANYAQGWCTEPSPTYPVTLDAYGSGSGGYVDGVYVVTTTTPTQYTCYLP